LSSSFIYAWFFCDTLLPAAAASAAAASFSLSLPLCRFAAAHDVYFLLLALLFADAMPPMPPPLPITTPRMLLIAMLLFLPLFAILMFSRDLRLFLHYDYFACLRH